MQNGSVRPRERPLADRVLVIGHRGASAHLPEHTLAAYGRAIDDGADAIEPDLVATGDGVLVARHENEISGTTDVADRSEFASRRATRTIDGVPVTGWFTEDFTLAELKTLRARERIPGLRPASARFDGRFEVPTLAEVIALVREGSERTGRAIGLYPETKHPSYFRSIGLALEDRLIVALEADEFSARIATVWIQSFETANLRAIRARIGARPNWRLVQLMERAGRRPYDFVTAGDARDYGALMTPAGLREVAAYADAIGPEKSSVVAVGAAGAPLRAGDLVRHAHAAGLLLHPYTFRPENAFLPVVLRSGGADGARHVDGALAEIRAHLDAGVDGFFTDDPALGRQAVDEAAR